MKPKIKQVQVELTHFCNAHCAICTRPYSKRKPNHMPIYLLRKIVDEVKDKKYATPLLPMGLCGIGDPSLHPHFFHAIEIASQVPFALGSNMQEFDEPKIDCIIKHKFNSFCASLDAFTEEAYKGIRCGLDFTKVMYHASMLLGKLKDKPRFWDTVYLQFVVTKHNVQDIPKFQEYWLRKIKNLDGVKISFKPICPWPGDKANSCWPGPNATIEPHYQVISGYFDRPFMLRENCCLPFHWAQVMSDGTFTFCCMNTEDVYGIGNVKDFTLEELFNSPVMEIIRSKFKAKEWDKIPFCADCH